MATTARTEEHFCRQALKGGLIGHLPTLYLSAPLLKHAIDLLT